ncbi:MAG: phenylalanine--tRNA ligase subunit beta [Chlamydiae bacterium]|nr:phenylalanine--tRNA ligase subunit beta [Chlamydiota bacterium]
MKVTLSWLKEYLPLNISSEKIAEVLTLAGIEVEGIETIGSNFSGVVTAKVISTTAHPNADKLCVAVVFDGTEELQIVCGAKNCRPGLITALAKIGAKLPPDENGKPFTIKKGKLRDVESFGMLCGADELGLTKQGDGIVELDAHLPLGVDLSTLYGDVIFDLSLTPNLGHCLSVRGIARELSALLMIPLKDHPVHIQEKGPDIHKLLKVQVEDKDLCHRYTARVLQKVTVGPSPEWLQRRLLLSGVRSINNIVDISNYVMLQIGQPLHIFDYDQIKDHELMVTTRSQSDHLRTLDDLERKIPKNTLLISDTQQPLAFAGIMGGFTSAVTERTKTIVVESAAFSAQSIRKSCKDLGLKTDASQRFERGVDSCALKEALDLACSLLHTWSGAEIASGLIDHNYHPHIPKKITCRIDKVQRTLGLDISLREVVSILERLEIRVAKEHINSLEVIVPSYRNDLQEEIDLIEEIIRLYGYNKIPKNPPLHVSSLLNHAPMFSLENKVRDLLMAEGLQELITCDLISPSLAELTKEPSQKHIEQLSVLHSKSLDYSVMRSTLLSGLLQSVQHNMCQKTSDLMGFEIGRIHLKQDEKIHERSCAGVILTGQSTPHHHEPKNRDLDFYDLKGIIENLYSFFKIDNLSFEVSHLHNFQPGRQARIIHKGETLGVIGEVHPNTLGKIDIKQRIFYAELNLHQILHLQPRTIQVQPLPQFPGSERDWTLTVKKETSLADILGKIEEEQPTILTKVFMLDLFESEKLGSDRKNITLRFCYRDKEKTLSYEMVEEEHAKVTQKVAKKLQHCLL